MKRTAKNFRTRILKVFLIGYFLIILTLFIYSSYLSKSYTESLQNSGNAMMNLYVNELDNLLRISRDYLNEIITLNTEAKILQSITTEVVKYGAAYELIKSMRAQLTLEEGISGFIIHYNGRYYYIFQDSMSFDTKKEINTFISDRIKEKQITRDWMVIEGTEKPFLALTYSSNETYITIVIDFESVTSEVLNKYASNETEIVFQNDDMILQYSPIAKWLAKEQGKDAPGSSRGNTVHDKYMVFSNSITDTTLTMNVLIPNGNVFTLQTAQYYVFGILLLAILCAVVSVFYLYGEFIAPLQSMTQTMQDISAGQITAEMSAKYDVEEFRQTASIFNGMMKQIRELKIQSYEKEIQEQKARLQYLQLQIRPHFFLNCLKTFYALLQQNKKRALEDAIMDTSKFFRYIFRDTFTPVTVREELNFTQEYLNLQKNSAGILIDCEISADDKVLDTKLLPLTIQTFVENSIKYARPNGKLQIRITLKILSGEEASYLDLTVSDNGQGYSDEWLKRMNEPDYHMEDGQHVGVLNLKRRLYLHYGEAAEFAVRNHYGAISEVIIPIPFAENLPAKEIESVSCNE